MKKVRNLLITAIVAVCAAIACFAFAACGGTETALEGTYKLSSVIISDGENTTTVKVGEEYQGVVLSEDMLTLELRADGTFSLTFDNGDGDEGTWAKGDGVVKLIVGETTIDVPRDGKTVTIDFIDKDTIYILSK